MLSFDDAKHEYRYGGKVVPSVTQILKPVSPDFSLVPADTLERARKLGNAVDATITLYELNDLDEESLSPLLRSYLDAWLEFKSATKFVVEAVQLRVYNERFAYAGTLDVMGRFPSGSLAVIDVKRTMAVPRHAGPQTAAYAEALGRKAERFAMHLKPRDDGSISWRLEPLKSAEDWNVFMSCLVIHRFNSSRK